MSRILGHYEILEPLGAGGMGEVYRARDTKLERDVALKLLPRDLADDPERLARLEREAKLLASLNHANIATVHGLEEQGGERFIVLELVRGRTLDECLASGALPVEQALQIGAQIAEALEAAHEAGIIHRDLKPANVIVTPEGKAKVLDFGIAKSAAPAARARTEAATELTMAGVLIGTAPYMSPEQVRGDDIDKRADIWAFGCLLFEALCGRRPFQRETLADTLAAIIEIEPDFEALPEATPEAVRRLLRRCLEKNPRTRLRDIGDARIEIVEVQRRVGDDAARSGLAIDSTTGRATGSAIRPGPSSVGLRGLSWALAGIVVGLAIGVAASSLWRGVSPAVTPASPGVVARFPVFLPPGQRFTGRGGRVLDISPDGRRIAYVADGQLWVRDLDAEEPRLVAGTQMGGAHSVRDIFFSHDGEWIGFFAGGAVMRASATSGGATRTLWPSEERPWRPHWTADDTIFIGVGDQGIWRGPGAGGQPEPVITLPEGERAYAPQLLPGNEWMLYALLPAGSSSMADARVVVESLETGERDVLVEGRDARYVTTGHLLFAVGEVLLAAPFDIGTRTVTGAARTVIESVFSLSGTTRAQYSVADNGTLVYLAAGGPAPRGLVWVDASGDEEELGALPPLVYGSPRVSPDGTKVLVGHTDADGSDPGRSYWDIERGVLVPVPAEIPSSSAWAADSAHIFVAADRPGGGRELYIMPIDGRTGADVLLTTSGESRPHAVTRDGRLVYVQRGPGSEGAMDILLLQPGDEQPRQLVATPAHEARPALSRDESWMAYQSDESGRVEVWAASFPDTDRRVRISNGGGTEPKWSPQGDQLYYIHPDESVLMAVPFDPGDGTFGAPTPLFSVEEYELPLTNGSNYDIAPDGRFVFMRAIAEPGDATAGPHFNVVVNWFEELKRRVPAGPD